MAKSKEQCLKQVADSGVVAVIRANSKDQLAGLTEALLAGGVVGIEVTMSTPKAIAGIEMLADKFGDSAVIGVGTVIDAATARDAIAAGAQFVVSPVFDPEIVATARRYGKAVIPGGFTPTEILKAWAAGADVVKVFPSTVLGPGYLKDLLAPLPQLKLTPTGGVDLKNVGEWIKAGAVFVGVGSSLVTKDALAKSDWSSVTANGKAFVEAIRAARAK
jgi:2-dehydro-3-deoxyphosphogluconate aldolase / (4S)-4-hydroxy-2-oxoglutarate aldolase